jgi:hypothetical protein
MEIVEIEGVRLRLSPPDELNVDWIGNDDVMSQIIAAWTILDEKDIPLNPRILGMPGVGKTTLAYTAAKKITEKNGSDVYIFQCTQDTRPDDLAIQPVIGESNKIQYHASSLATAVIKGGICIMDEANRMSEKAWASLAPLLDRRRYFESIVAGIKIKAHPNFKIAVTMNEDSSTYEIPEYIDSRLNPKIFLDFPEAKDEFEILKYNVPYADSNILNYIVAFLQEGHDKNKAYSVRDGINMARYYMKLVDAEEKNYEKPKEEEKTEEETEYFYPDLFELSIRQILDDDAIDFFNRRILDTLGSKNSNNSGEEVPEEYENDEKSGALGEFLDDTVDYEDFPDKKVKKNEGFPKYWSKDEKSGEFFDEAEDLNDEEEKFHDSENEERDGSNFITFLDEEEKKKRLEEKDDFYVNEDELSNSYSNSEYLRDLKKKIRSNLKKIKSEEKKTKKTKKSKKKS